jgi:hypothetical protein
LVHKDRWFKPFKTSWKIIKASCSTSDIQNKVNSAWKWDTILMPACTMNWVIEIRNNYVLLRWAWMWKTILNWMIKINANHVVVSDLTVNARWYIGWIDAYRNTWGYILVERVEAKNGWRAWWVKVTRYPYNTVRYSKFSNSLHGIADKLANKTQFYSNEAFNNSNYWIDCSTVDKVEIAWNYFHDNAVAWTKTPNAKEVHYHHNDINNNKQYWIIYYRDWSNSWKEFWKDTYDQKWELLLEYNNLRWNAMWWFNWHWRNDVDPQMNYLYLKYNDLDHYSCANCKVIETWWDNWTPKNIENSKIIKH